MMSPGCPERWCFNRAPLNCGLGISIIIYRKELGFIPKAVYLSTATCNYHQRQENILPGKSASCLLTAWWSFIQNLALWLIRCTTSLRKLKYFLPDLQLFICTMQKYIVSRVTMI